MTNKQDKRKIRKMFTLFIVIFITAVVLVVETYAWFVGITTVNVDQFQVSVTTEQGLEISLNGKYWVTGNGSANTLRLVGTRGSNPDENRINILYPIGDGTGTGNSCGTDTTNCAYVGHKNAWPSNGLTPVSSSGVLTTTGDGRLNIFSKSSLSSTSGGYKLVSNQLTNTTTEADGYIAFDLFIRNGRDNNYKPANYSSSAAENIYLTTNSEATGPNGTNIGAANSIRVGFFLLAGTKTTTATDSTTVSALQGLSCQTTTSGNNKKLCPEDGEDQGVYWNIWEPNYNVHTTEAREYFNRICKIRTDANTYTTACTGFTANNSQLLTYAVHNEFDTSANVDVYDGLNTYTATRATSYPGTSAQLMQMTTYKTPANANSYEYNNQLFKLAGNSITKVRVYIWLEGQDVDNYDVVAGEQFNIKFGFTKDRFGIGPSPSP